MPLISIIVPIYNAENTLHCCIDSILKQSFKDFELILVDDGSLDSSGKICDEYAEKDKKIKVIHKKNEGVSSARNTGIIEAKGQFICFADSDDKLKEDFLSRMYNTAKENDSCLVVCGYDWIENGNVIKTTVLYDDNKIVTVMRSNVMDLFVKVMISAPWCKLFRSDIIKNNNLFFPNDFSLGEDLIFNFSYIDYIDKLTIINIPLYDYCVDNDNSLLRKYRKDLLENTVKMNQKIFEYISNWNLDRKQMVIFYNSVYYGYENALLNTFSKNNSDGFFEKLSFNRSILKSKNFKNALSSASNLKINIIYRLAYKLHSYSIILLYNNLRHIVRR